MNKVRVALIVAFLLGSLAGIVLLKGYQNFYSDEIGSVVSDAINGGIANIVTPRYAGGAIAESERIRKTEEAENERIGKLFRKWKPELVECAGGNFEHRHFIASYELTDKECADFLERIDTPAIRSALDEAKVKGIKVYGAKNYGVSSVGIEIHHLATPNEAIAYLKNGLK